MAITVLQAPAASGYISAHEDVWHVVNSTQKNQPGFRYIFNISKSGSLLTSIQTSPYPGFKFGALNVGNIVRSTLKFAPISSVDLTTNWKNSPPVETFGNDYFFTDYTAEYIESYGGGNYLVASGTYRVYNTYNRHPLHGADLKLNQDNTALYTNRPDTSYYYQGEPVIISGKYKDSFNRPNNYYLDDNGSNFETIEADEGLDGYNRLVLNGFTSNEMYLFVGFGDQDIYETKIFLKKCSKYKVYTLAFINSFGAWDSFTFHSGEIMMENEKKKYDTNEWQLFGQDMGGLVIGQFLNRGTNAYNEKTKIYASEFKTKMKLTSDVLNTEEYKWLFELIVSPLVYIYDKDNSVFHPVQITDTNYNMKDSTKNKAEVLEVNIDVYKQNTQFR